MIGGEGEAWCEERQGQGSKAGLGARLCCKVAQSSSSRPHHCVLAVVEQLRHHPQPPRAADEAARVDCPLHRGRK